MHPSARSSCCRDDRILSSTVVVVVVASLWKFDFGGYGRVVPPQKGDKKGEKKKGGGEEEEVVVVEPSWANATNTFTFDPRNPFFSVEYGENEDEEVEEYKVR